MLSSSVTAGKFTSSAPTAIPFGLPIPVESWKWTSKCVAVPLLVVLSGCGGGAPATLSPSAAPAASVAPAASIAQPSATRAATPPAPVQIATGTTPACEPFDWAPRALPLLLRPGKPAAGKRAEVTEHVQHADRAAAEQGAFDSQCQDAPDGPSGRSPTSVTIDGVQLDLLSITPAGKSGRGWLGNQCAFSARLADGSGTAVRLAGPEIPPFKRIGAVVRSGSAVFLSISFNGYSKEFPQGGNRVLALDLCAGRVVWQSPDSTSNSGLLLLGDYLISPYGFTSEQRSLFILDARSGSVGQRLPVVENVCPSERWAPHWQRGERCDPPGQKVGAATNPHVRAGKLLVDTNTGSAAFEFE